MSNLDASAAHPFWQFSLAVYAVPEVQAECLALQDAHDIDVNLLLFVAWVGACRRLCLEPAAVDRARETVGAWNRDVVKPLRQARRAAKTLGATSLRRSIAEVELGAEGIEQDLLYAFAGTLAAPATQAAIGDPAAIVRRNIGLLLDPDEGKGPRPAFPEALAAAAASFAADNTP